MSTFALIAAGWTTLLLLTCIVIHRFEVRVHAREAQARARLRQMRAEADAGSRTGRDDAGPGAALDCGALRRAGGYHDHGNGNAGLTIRLNALPTAMHSFQKIEDERDDLRGEVERLREGWDSEVEWANQLLFERDWFRQRWADAQGCDIDAAQFACDQALRAETFRSEEV